MSRFLSCLMSLFGVVGASVVLAQQPHWYVLLEPGNDRWYHGANHHIHERVTGHQDDWSVVEVDVYDGDYLSSSYVQLWRIDSEGDVWNGGTCVIDMPLEVGKSWGTTWGEFDQYYDWYSIVGWTEYGGLDCVIISEAFHGDGSDTIFTTVRLYSDGRGLVHYTFIYSGHFIEYNLEEVNVGTEVKTWSEIKAMFHGEVGVPPAGARAP